MEGIEEILLARRSNALTFWNTSGEKLGSWFCESVLEKSKKNIKKKYKREERRRERGSVRERGEGR